MREVMSNFLPQIYAPPYTWFFLLIIGVLLIVYLIYRSGLLVTYRLRKNLTDSYVDFLANLLVFEANGVRLDEVLDYASRDKTLLPKPYSYIVKLYTSMSRIISDPYTILVKISDSLPCKRVAFFLKGYAEVLITTNDTKHYVESELKNVIQKLYADIFNTLSYVDSLYEGLLILLLGFIVYMYLPLSTIPYELVSILLTLLGLAGYVFVHNLSQRSFWPNNSSLDLLTLLVLIIAPFFFRSINLSTIFIIAYFLIFFIAFTSYQRLLRLDYEASILLEEVYSSINQKMPLDQAVIKACSRLSKPYRIIKNLLLLGFNYSDFKNAVKLTPYAEKVLGLLLSPLKYSSSDILHIGYIVKISDFIRRIRTSLAERCRVYYIYALTLPAVLIVFSHSMRGLGGFKVLPIGLVTGLALSSILVSVTISSKIEGGCGLCSWKNPLVLITTLLAVLLLA